MLTGPGFTIAKARKLRKDLSLPEVLLWQQLRQRPGGHKFQRQHPAGPYILDFACIASRIAIEIDGEVHGASGASAHDEARDEWLVNQGYRVLRIAARDVLQNMAGVVTLVTSYCTSAQPLHQPSATGCSASRLRLTAGPRHAARLHPPSRAGEDL